ncbi:MAG: hypothetical protein WC895_05415, partial [Candidatus Shapirobacteria bacterium]
MTIELKIDLVKERRRLSRNTFGMPGKGRNTYFIDEKKQSKKDACRNKFSLEEYIHVKKLDLEDEQIEVLEEYDVVGELSKITGKSVHEYMIHNDAYTDGHYLIFF